MDKDAENAKLRRENANLKKAVNELEHGLMGHHGAFASDVPGAEEKLPGWTMDFSYEFAVIKAAEKGEPVPDRVQWHREHRSELPMPPETSAEHIEHSQMHARMMADSPIMQDLYDSEISGKIEWLWDGRFWVYLGTGISGYDADGIVRTWDEVPEWFRDTAVRCYPQNDFAKKYRDVVSSRKRWKEAEGEAKTMAKSRIPSSQSSEMTKH